jgi:hypothetical protein
MRLAKLSEFRRLIYTTNSAPTLSTLRARIYEIPGGTIHALATGFVRVPSKLGSRVLILSFGPAFKL